MPLVKARCTSCDGELQVDSSKDAAICPYCGTPYIIEKAINNYNKTVNNNFNGANINVNVSGILDADTMFENWLAATNDGTKDKLHNDFKYNYATDGRCKYMDLRYHVGHTYNVLVNIDYNFINNLNFNNNEDFDLLERLAKRYVTGERFGKYFNNEMLYIKQAKEKRKAREDRVIEHEAEVARYQEEVRRKSLNTLILYGIIIVIIICLLLHFS